VDGSTLFISASFAFRFQEQKKEEIEKERKRETGRKERRYISNAVSRRNLSACLPADCSPLETVDEIRIETSLSFSLPSLSLFLSLSLSLSLLRKSKRD